MAKRKLKVFGGLTAIQGRAQVRTIVAAASKKAAAALVGVTLHEFNGYWCETGNETELAVALLQPGVVFKASDSMSKDFLPAEPRDWSPAWARTQEKESDPR